MKMCACMRALCLPCCWCCSMWSDLQYVNHHLIALHNLSASICQLIGACNMNARCVQSWIKGELDLYNILYLSGALRARGKKTRDDGQHSSFASSVNSRSFWIKFDFNTGFEVINEQALRLYLNNTYLIFEWLVKEYFLKYPLDDFSLSLSTHGAKPSLVVQVKNSVSQVPS